MPTNLFFDTPSFTPDGKKVVFFARGPVTGAAERGVRASFTPGARRGEGARQAGSGTSTWGITRINLDGTGATLYGARQLRGGDPEFLFRGPNAPSNSQRCSLKPKICSELRKENTDVT